MCGRDSINQSVTEIETNHRLLKREGRHLPWCFHHWELAANLTRVLCTGGSAAKSFWRRHALPISLAEDYEKIEKGGLGQKDFDFSNSPAKRTSLTRVFTRRFQLIDQPQIHEEQRGVHPALGRVVKLFTIVWKCEWLYKFQFTVW